MENIVEPDPTAPSGAVQEQSDQIYTVCQDLSWGD